ncbi:MAG: acyl-CoA dehydrogenase [Rhizobiales bacterium]|nr:acyl-CoA dehydrogenase [Hyphomicrobiales bacterium]
MNGLEHLIDGDEALLLETVGRYVSEAIAPLADETDRSAIWVDRQLSGLGEIGVLGANLPEEYGGPGISPTALYGVVEAIAAGCGSTVSALTAHFLATDAILIAGGDALRREFLPRAGAGTLLGAFALTEPGAGSDPADMRTRAEPVSDGWRLRGRKCFISNAGYADFTIVFAVSDPGAGHRGISTFLVERGTAGFVPGRPEETMGLRGGHVFEIDIDCVVPAERMLGSEGSGFRTAMKVLDNGRIEVAAMCTGTARRALDLSIDWSRERRIGGEPLARRQGIGWMLADMALDLQRARLLGLDAARQRGLGGRFSLAAAMAKLAASEMVGRVTDGALQIHGGYGYMRATGIERLVRDVRIMRIYEGSSEIQRNIIAGHLLS